MNTGLGDAMNLGWKLAATVKGWAPADLLDSYTAERHPVGAWALDWTRAQVAIMRPTSHARAIAKVIRDLIDTRDGTTYFIQKVSGLLLRYDLGDTHPVLGRIVPDFELQNGSQDGSRLGDFMHDGTGILLDLNGNEALGTLAQPWTGRVKYLSARAQECLGLAALLVRPDGFVAWATDGEPDLASLEAAMRRWFGSPA